MSKKPTPNWIAGQLRVFAAAARHPQLRKAIFYYDHFRSRGYGHEDALIKAAKAAGLDINKLADLKSWKN